MKEYWDEITDKRNRKLIDCDWTQLPDCQLSDSKKAEWTTYRQALRDITKQTPADDALSNITWPTKPE